MDREFPILEFDEDRGAFIRPEQAVQRLDVPQRCVLCFFSEAIAALLEEYPHEEAGFLKAESQVFPVYVLTYKGARIGLIQAAVGGPVAAAQIEELNAMGFTRFMVCGSCGVLDKDVVVGHVIVPDSAVRDEGTSYHYAAPSREIKADPAVLGRIEAVLKEKDIPYLLGKTWTTDAIYRETPAKIKKRKAEGCITVEMEASAYMAVAQHIGVALGQLLYAGDNLGGAVWDSRDFINRHDIRAFVLQTTLEICLAV